MKTPRDPALFFTIFFVLALSFILTAWILLPAHVKIGEDTGGGGEESKPKPVLRGEKALLQAEAELSKADEILSRLEKEKADEKDKEKKAKGKEPSKNEKNDKTPKQSDAKTSTTKK
ncbi:MAG TPA: hypothetical protein VFH55_13035 [Nitrospiria bacterium]|nr:hypothetical protein [Nitrospiria bacterium]